MDRKKMILVGGSILLLLVTMAILLNNYLLEWIRINGFYFLFFIILIGVVLKMFLSFLPPAREIVFTPHLFYFIFLGFFFHAGFLPDIPAVTGKLFRYPLQDIFTHQFLYQVLFFSGLIYLQIGFGRLFKEENLPASRSMSLYFISLNIFMLVSIALLVMFLRNIYY